MQKIGVIADKTEKAQHLLSLLLEDSNCIKIDHSPDVPLKILVVIGGDGTMLHSIHKYIHLNIPFCGIRTGHLGFLMNSFEHDRKQIMNSLNDVQEISFHPLQMNAVDINGENFSALAVNEVALLRQVHQAANIEISINDRVELRHLIGDGVMVATPTGSTAYNSSVGGPILPIGTNLLALTPISPFRPRRWRGVLLKNDSKITLKVIDPKKRPVSVAADFFDVRNISQVSVSITKAYTIRLLFNAHQSFHDRIMREQFALD